MGTGLFLQSLQENSEERTSVKNRQRLYPSLPYADRSASSSCSFTVHYGMERMASDEICSILGMKSVCLSARVEKGFVSAAQRLVTQSSSLWFPDHKGTTLLFKGFCNKTSINLQKEVDGCGHLTQRRTFKKKKSCFCLTIPIFFCFGHQCKESPNSSQVGLKAQIVLLEEQRKEVSSFQSRLIFILSCHAHSFHPLSSSASLHQQEVGKGVQNHGAILQGESRSPFSAHTFCFWLLPFYIHRFLIPRSDI